MKSFVVQWLETITGIAFVLIVVLGVVSGAQDGPLGALLGLVGGLIGGIFATGLVYTLLSINERLGNIHSLMEQQK
ncbi:hypothetical protein BOW53_04495 [Solemya pervernicosa gill symbiont]|uniref:Uncharacterized protein n=1 Tax=Solemya pervernicosa gill symbiont TaxID=642797 RepID=A0A1T2L886_9GAMM|nr:hypothetical protein [Solemya pervernicosa gill symbiont]OOZ41244.1 hypothetical protein BOW53_04495 [Solemya pervernicosa gill symbiont]